MARFHTEWLVVLIAAALLPTAAAAEWGADPAAVHPLLLVSGILVTGDTSSGGDVLFSLGVDSTVEEHAIVIYRKDLVQGPPDTFKVGWLLNGSFIKSPLAMIVSGRCDFQFDPLLRRITAIPNSCQTTDPIDGGNRKYMIGAESDTKGTLFLRAGSVKRSTVPEHEIMLVTDNAEDETFRIGASGRLDWADGGTSLTSGTSDGDDTFDVSLQRHEVGADEILVVTTDGDGDGPGTRGVALSRPMPQGTGAADKGGVLVWGDTDLAAIDTGDEICDSVPRGGDASAQTDGLACATVFVPGSASERACNTPPGATMSGYFYALCY